MNLAYNLLNHYLSQKLKLIKKGEKMDRDVWVTSYIYYIIIYLYIEAELDF